MHAMQGKLNLDDNPVVIVLQTYTGSILVAVNPYKMFDIYGLDMVKKYEGQILGTLPP
jgi:myosin-15